MCGLAGLLVLSGAGSVHAESGVSAKDILKALQPEKTSATRSLVPQTKKENVLSEDEKKFLGSITTRGLKVESLVKAGQILTKRDVPSLDIEIQFQFDSSDIDPRSLADLKALATALSDRSLQGSRFMLNGHTDARGPDLYNQRLSQLRAEAVRSYLVEKHNIDVARLVAVGFGERRLKEPGLPESSTNRRVEIINLGE